VLEILEKIHLPLVKALIINRTYKKTKLSLPPKVFFFFFLGGLSIDTCRLSLDFSQCNLTPIGLKWLMVCKKISFKGKDQNTCRLMEYLTIQVWLLNDHNHGYRTLQAWVNYTGKQPCPLQWIGFLHFLPLIWSFFFNNCLRLWRIMFFYLKIYLNKCFFLLILVY
jgi:hypothetical protein